MKNNRFYKAFRDHQLWLRSGKKESSPLHLVGEDLANIKIKDICLDGALFENCSFERATFQDITFEEVVFSNNLFNFASFSNIGFTNSILENNKFRYCKFSNTAYKSVHCNNNSFAKSVMNEEKYDDCFFSNNKYLYGEMNDISLASSSVYSDEYKGTAIANLEIDRTNIVGSHYQDLTISGLSATSSFIDVIEENIRYLNCESENPFSSSNSDEPLGEIQIRSIFNKYEFDLAALEDQIFGFKEKLYLSADNVTDVFEVNMHKLHSYDIRLSAISYYLRFKIPGSLGELQKCMDKIQALRNTIREMSAYEHGKLEQIGSFLSGQFEQRPDNNE